MDWTLTLLTFAPVLAIPLLWLSGDAKVQRGIATAAAGVSMVLSFVALAGFWKAGPEVAFGKSLYKVDLSWISAGSFEIRYAMDVDALSVFMGVLTGILGFVAAISGYGIQQNVRG